MARALTHHWPEYLMEALGLGLYMAIACLVSVAIEHPASPVRGVVRRAAQHLVGQASVV